MNVELDGDTSWPKLVFLGVLSRFWTIISVVSFVVLMGLWVGFLPPLPRFVEVGLVASIAATPFGWIAGVYAAGDEDPQYHYLIDVEVPGNVGDKGALYELAESDFRELDVRDDSLEDWSPYLHAGKGVHIDQLLVEEGTWAASMTDRELMTARAKLAELRGQLEEDAKKGFVLETNAFIIIRGATQAAVQRIVETFERGTLPDDGDGLNERIDDALDRFDLGGAEDAVQGDPLDELDFDLDDVIDGDDDNEIPDNLGLPSPEGGEADDD